MVKKKKTIIKMQCTVCKSINYHTKKSKKLETGGAKMELKKYCKKCKKHTVHKETKK